MGRRNYTKEYSDYYGAKNTKLSDLTPTQRRHRREKTSRNRARRKMKKLGYKVKGKDIDHVNGNPLDNSRKNLRVQSVKKNRANK